MSKPFELDTNDSSKTFLIKDIKVYVQDVKMKNPYNSIAVLEVVSGNFCGTCEIDLDFFTFVKFGLELKQLYQNCKGTVIFKPVSGETYIEFNMDINGALIVKGILVDYSSQQSLKFSFQTDQTAVGKLSNSIEKFAENIKLQM